jgi:hypothetical protein
MGTSFGHHSESTFEAHRRLVEAGERFQREQAAKRREKLRRAFAGEGDRLKAEALAREEQERQAKLLARLDAIACRRASVWMRLDAIYAEMRRRKASISTVQSIISEIANKHNLTPELICSPDRHWHIVRARWEAMYECFLIPSQSQQAIGRHFNRDHSSVRYAVIEHCLRNQLSIPRGLSGKTRLKASTVRKRSALTGPRA